MSSSESTMRADVLFVEGGAAAPPRSDWESISYSDIHGLHGGVGVWIRSDGKLEVLHVERGMLARSRVHALGERGIRELEGLLRQHDITTMVVPEADRIRGYAIPDESFATIVLKTDEATHVLRKSDHDKHPGFDQLQSWFFEVAATLASHMAPTEEGTWDYTGPGDHRS